MKVLLLCTCDHFGAGNAAYRLFEGLQRAGHQTTMLVKEKKKPLSVKLEDPLQSDMLRNTFYKMYYEDSAGEIVSNTLAAGLSNYQLQEIAADYDVIHFHWINLMVSLENIRFLSNLGKKLIFTLHDENLFTGGCHYRSGCEKFQTGCVDCEVFRNMKRWAELECHEKRLALPREAVFVSPSKWLAQAARQSYVLRDRQVEVIPNGIDADIFHPRHRKKGREKLGIPDGAPVLLFGACSLTEKRKGLRYFLEALRMIKGAPGLEQLRVFSFGSAEGLELPEVGNLGFLEDEQELAEIYAAADLMVLPSLEDNFPNVMLESLLCGTPVAAFRTGGMAETIQHGKNGMLAAMRDSADLAGCILEALKGPSMRAFARADAEQRFGLELFTRRYLDLYARAEPAASSMPSDGRLHVYMTAQLSSYEQNCTAENFQTFAGNLHESYAGIIENLLEQAGQDLHREVERFARAMKTVERAFQEGKTVALWGYGYYGKLLKKTLGEKIACVADRNPGESGVLSIEELRELSRENLYIFVAIGAGTETVADTLTSWGLERGVQFGVF